MPVTCAEVLKTINNLKNKKSTGCDRLSVQLIKNISNAIVEPLAAIINLSFSSGVFPSKLKQSIVVPIHKKGRIDLVEHYRPIALLSIIAKIIEKCMKNRLLEFLNNKDFFSSNQFMME